MPRRATPTYPLPGVCRYNGTRVWKLRRSWTPLSGIAGLGTDVIPHTLRHTRATWLMQAGIEPWEAAGHLGMSLEVLQRVYGNTRQIFRNGEEELDLLERRAAAEEKRKELGL